MNRTGDGERGGCRGAGACGGYGVLGCGMVVVEEENISPGVAVLRDGGLWCVYVCIWFEAVK